eukprot:TRINITY_DN13908_c0_g1_i1.p1 TRINITY_DN13908_c0_g1~~TRINITY_DN13908_c0_g1_i1.p1  ORF type:complete len:279 (+),score=28.51 TRINITY_DN13908_c0_g1_i1:73-909(+)
MSDWPIPCRQRVLLLLVYAIKNEDQTRCRLATIPLELLKLICSFFPPAVMPPMHYYALDNISKAAKIIHDGGEAEEREDGAITGEVLPSSTGFKFDQHNWITFSPKLGSFRVRDFTVSLWIQTTSAKSNSAILSNRAAGSHGNFFCIRFACGCVVVELDDMTNYIPMRNEMLLNNGQWHHIVCTRKGVTASLYVDSLLEQSKDSNGIVDIAGGSALMIGSSPVASIYRLEFSGKVSQVKIWNDYVLTQDQVSYLYKKSKFSKKPVAGSKLGKRSKRLH